MKKKLLNYINKIRQIFEYFKQSKFYPLKYVPFNLIFQNAVSGWLFSGFFLSLFFFKLTNSTWAKVTFTHPDVNQEYNAFIIFGILYLPFVLNSLRYTSYFNNLAKWLQWVYKIFCSIMIIFFFLPYGQFLIRPALFEIYNNDKFSTKIVEKWFFKFEKPLTEKLAKEAVDNALNDQLSKNVGLNPEIFNEKLRLVECLLKSEKEATELLKALIKQYNTFVIDNLAVSTTLNSKAENSTLILEKIIMYVTNYINDNSEKVIFAVLFIIAIIFLLYFYGKLSLSDKDSNSKGDTKSTNSDSLNSDQSNLSSNLEARFRVLESRILELEANQIQLNNTCEEFAEQVIGNINILKTVQLELKKCLDELPAQFVENQILKDAIAKEIANTLIKKRDIIQSPELKDRDDSSLTNN